MTQDLIQNCPDFPLTNVGSMSADRSQSLCWTPVWPIKIYLLWPWPDTDDDLFDFAAYRAIFAARRNPRPDHQQNQLMNEYELGPVNNFDMRSYSDSGGYRCTTDCTSENFCEKQEKAVFTYNAWVWREFINNPCYSSVVSSFGAYVFILQSSW